MDAFLEKPLKAAAFKECLQRVGFLSSHDSSIGNASVRSMPSAVSNASGPLGGQGSGNSASSVPVASPPADGSGDGASGQKPLVLVVDDSLMIAAEEKNLFL